MDRFAKIAQNKTENKEKIKEVEPQKFTVRKAELTASDLGKTVYAESVDQRAVRSPKYRQGTIRQFLSVFLSHSRFHGGLGGEKLGDGEVQFAAAEKYFEGKRYIISTFKLRKENPVAQRFFNYIVKG